MLLHVQCHIWRTGFQSNELVGVVFDDVAEALERWHASGIKVYVPFTRCFLLLASLGQLHSY
jgi:methionine salvage enolase-phosphatase E1